MVKINFYKINKDESSSVTIDGDRLLFSIPKPTIVQPSEIIKIKTGIIMKVPSEHVVIISTYPDRPIAAAELFPAVVTMDGCASETELELAVKNSGRGQLNILPGVPFAVGYVIRTHTIEFGEFEPDAVTPSPKEKSVPQKKNSFSFEVK